MIGLLLALSVALAIWLWSIATFLRAYRDLKRIARREREVHRG